jgi:hypothetical protein
MGLFDDRKLLLLFLEIAEPFFWTAEFFFSNLGLPLLFFFAVDDFLAEL